VFRALGSADNDPHWLAVTRESALLRGIPVGESRKPLSRVTLECSDQLKRLLMALGELTEGREEQGLRDLVSFTMPRVE
jgi:hypothetical protein